MIPTHHHTLMSTTLYHHWHLYTQMVTGLGTSFSILNDESPMAGSSLVRGYYCLWSVLHHCQQGIATTHKTPFSCQLKFIVQQLTDLGDTLKTYTNHLLQFYHLIFPTKAHVQPQGCWVSHIPLDFGDLSIWWQHLQYILHPLMTRWSDRASLQSANWLQHHWGALLADIHMCRIFLFRLVLLPTSISHLLWSWLIFAFSFLKAPQLMGL